ncbi:flagellar basal body rod protein FlgB [Pseudoduganella sp. R-34]|jgi:flagellar basal-body rod protein FlgB|uniref:flagellar basal body rod protein FlgB n=1 Tax=unclassified Pseudoduganella TaxID=2637179 RepID=UPI003CF23BA1
MVPMIEESTTRLLGMALDAAVMRQQAIAQNIANANTPGYQRIGVSFESRVAGLMDAAGQVRAPSLSELAAYRPRLETLAPSNANQEVALDMELAQLSQTTLQHQALLKALNKHLSVLGTAINEGKR